MYLVGLTLTVAVVGCSRQEDAEPTAPSAAPATAAEPVPSPTISPLPAPSSTPAFASTPDLVSEQPPSINADDQELTDEGKVEIVEITTSGPSWIVIYNDQGGQPDSEIGYARVVGEPSESVSVMIDTINATPTMHAVLHSDFGVTGEYEYPGPDQPVEYEGQVVRTTFSVDIVAKMPELIVSDQMMVEEGTVVIDEVTADEDGYLALYDDDRGEPGVMLAYVPVTAGSVSNLRLEFNWRDAASMLHVVLHADAGEKDVFNPEIEDLPVSVAGEQVASSFHVHYPPDIFVLEQPVTNGIIEVERAVSYGPGWLVVYGDDDGSMGSIIGWAQLEDGINEMIDVEVTQSAVTSDLHLLLHQDLEEVGQFEFPRTDPPVRFNDRFPQPVTFETDSGNYLVTEDQQLGSGGVITVSLAVVDVDAWVVVRIEVDGEVGEIVGSTMISAGVNRDVKVILDPEQLTPKLHITLHLDAGAAGQFEFPEGLDIPLQRNRAAITVPMTLIPSDGR